VKSSNLSLAVIAVFFLLSPGVGKLGSHDVGLGSQALAAHASKAQRLCIRQCRARYHDCIHIDKLPSFECRDVYQDCAQYSCTGLGPG
jgi:hypothetical protein